MFFAAVLLVLGYQWPWSSTSVSVSPSTAVSLSTVARSIDLPRREHRDATGESEGSVPDGTTVFDDDVPGVANLDPDLLAALRKAADDAAGEGVKLGVDSGWRSPEYQERLLEQGILKYGSAEEAARWVASPNTSAHVSGDAVDIARPGAAWLSRHGAGYGLCQIYANEPWHFELRPAAGSGCPAMYADPTHDPRMQKK